MGGEALTSPRMAMLGEDTPSTTPEDNEDIIGGGGGTKRKRAGSTRLAKAALSDDELASYFQLQLESITECGNKTCDCLDDLFTHPKYCASVARYLVWFERKHKYDQNSIIAEWCKYASAHRGKIGRFMLLFQADPMEAVGDEEGDDEEGDSFLAKKKHCAPWALGK